MKELKEVQANNPGLLFPQQQTDFRNLREALLFQVPNKSMLSFTKLERIAQFAIYILNIISIIIIITTLLEIYFDDLIQSQINFK